MTLFFEREHDYTQRGVLHDHGDGCPLREPRSLCLVGAQLPQTIGIVRIGNLDAARALLQDLTKKLDEAAPKPVPAPVPAAAPRPAASRR